MTGMIKQLDEETKRLSGTVVAALLAVTVITLTLFGTLDELPGWLRGVVQSLGTLAGVWLGALLQSRNDQTSIEGTARSALANLVSLGKSLQNLVGNASDYQARCRESPPRTVEVFSRSSEAFVSGVDVQARSILAQARAAAEVWLPYVPDSDEYLNELAGTDDAKQ